MTDQTAHEDAKGLLLELIGSAIDGFQQKEPELNEDGHTDVPSAARKMKLAIEDAGQILAAIEGSEGDLPAWWMSKVTIATDYLNKARDYLLGSPSSKSVNVNVSPEEMEEQWKDKEAQSGLGEKLKPSMGAGAYVDDFRKSKAPQFKGKSKKKRQKMAIAAYLDDKDKSKWLKAWLSA